MSNTSQQEILYTVLAPNQEIYETVRTALNEKQVEIYLENPGRHRISVMNMTNDTQTSMIALGAEIYRNVQFDIDLKNSATPDRPSVDGDKKMATPTIPG